METDAKTYLSVYNAALTGLLANQELNFLEKGKIPNLNTLCKIALTIADETIRILEERRTDGGKNESI